MATEMNIPDGYWKDRQGNLVPDANVRETDKLRDAVVKELFVEAEEIHNRMREFKARAMDTIETHLDLVVEKYGAKRSKKGNVSLPTYDGCMKIEVQVAERISFGEELVAAEALVNDCFADWTEGVRPELKAMVDRAFRADSQGKISVYRVLDLLRLEIADPRWKRAMAAIKDSIKTEGSKSYIRFYRLDKDGGYDPVSLDIAKF